MVLLVVSGKKSFASENDQPGVSCAGPRKKMGFLGRYLVAPIENVVRYIADGACAFCHNIRSFLVVACAPLYNFFRGRAGATSESEPDLDGPESPAREEDSALHQSGADMLSGMSSETAGKPELSGLSPSCEVVLSGGQACSSPEESYGEQNGFPVSVLSERDGSCTGTFPADRGGEVCASTLFSSPVVSPDEGSVTSETTKTDSKVEGDFANDNPSFVNAGSHLEPAGKPEFSSAPDIDLNSSPSASGSFDGGGEAAVVMPGPDVAVPAEKTAVMEKEFLLDEASSDTLGDASFSAISFNAADELSDTDDEVFETADELSDTDDDAFEMADDHPFDADGEALLSDAGYDAIRSQSVFTAPHFSDSPHYNPIRQFLMANPDLKSDFPGEVMIDGEKRQQWSDLDFQRARLMVRDTGHCKKSGAPGKLADKAFLPLVGVDIFRNDPDNDGHICISQCTNSFSCRWLQRRNAPGIFLVNYILRNHRVVFYYAVPELDAIEESCRPLLKMLVSDNKEELEKAMKRFKMFIPPEKLAKHPVLAKILGSTVLLDNQFQIEGYCGESPESGGRYTEIHIDIRTFKNKFTSMILGKLLDRMENALPSLRLPIGFSVEPVAEDERGWLGKKLKTSIDSRLPEHIFFGIELFRPDIGRRELPRLQLPSLTVSSDQ